MILESVILPTGLQAALVVVCGLIFGSFVTMLSYRLPREEGALRGYSRCPSCQTRLRPAALVPLFSWLWQRGKCRYCRTPVSKRYPLIELTQALLFIAVYAVFGLNGSSLVLMLLTVALLVMVVVDFEWYIIPDEVQIACAVLAVWYHWLLATPVSEVLASAALGLVIGLALRYGYAVVRGKEGLGMGDVKFLPVAGMWMASIIDWVPFLFYSGLWGVITALAWRALGHGERFPFGPALAAALLMALLLPQSASWFWEVSSAYQTPSP